jgi:hypothetical protein
MVFSAPGYVGDYSVAVPAGLAVGDTFQFDGDLVKEAPPREKKSALDGPRHQPGAFVRAPVAVPMAMGSVWVCVGAGRLTARAGVCRCGQRPRRRPSCTPRARRRC